MNIKPFSKLDFLNNTRSKSTENYLITRLFVCVKQHSGSRYDVGNSHCKSITQTQRDDSLPKQPS